MQGAWGPSSLTTALVLRPANGRACAGPPPASASTYRSSTARSATHGNACTTGRRLRLGHVARVVRRLSAPSATNATRQGTRDPATGACSHPTKPDGTACGRWRGLALRSIAAQPGNASRADLADRCQGLWSCYRVKLSKGTASFVPAQGIRLADALEARAFDVKKIASLCVAAELGGTAVGARESPFAAFTLKAAKGSAKHVSRRNLSIIDGLGEFGVDTVRADT